MSKIKFRTFRIIVTLVVLAGASGFGWLFCGRRSPAPVAAAATPAVVVVKAPAAVTPPPAIVTSTSAATMNAALRNKLGAWLRDHPDRQGKMKLLDILPGESFKASAIRFKEGDAEKWSNNASQWSQIRIDLNCDGTDDEKWLLKNGALYKREVIDSSGRVSETQYLN